ncbi:abortive infection family protein [Streptomyces sp. NBC_00827]|uniref:abortive infection family protein n=1 Tax=Streptomyces sp. NBC_00827 TaxID=2903677 RepID=UPI0038688162|nr:abortive infection family protein [Streptomyces sp. NBC_00827]
MIQLLVQEPLPRAEGLQHDQWRAIEDAYGRLAAAVAADDRPLVVGSAKELVECVARVTLVAYGRVVADGDEYTKVLASAHQIIEHVIGPNIPGNHPLRQIPNYAQKMAIQLRELRNRYGTGHGRATIHDITNEVVDASVHAALVWVRWALTRLQTVLLGAIGPLVNDLHRGTFSKGDLAARLEAANIPRLDEAEQHRLGVAVGQRAARETFNVRLEGIRACTDAPQRWPDDYREGVVQGLFVNDDGQADAYAAASADCAAELLQHHSAPETVLTRLSDVLESASWSLRFQQDHSDIISAMKQALRKMPEEAKPAWNTIIAGLEARAPDGIR